MAALQVLQEQTEVWVQANVATLLPLQDYFLGEDLLYQVDPGSVFEGSNCQELFKIPQSSEALQPAMPSE